jgi:hypothetical protein
MTDCEALRDFLRDYDLPKIIAVLGRSDVLEVIGVERVLEYVQAVGSNPISSPDRRFCRDRVKELADNWP